ncbi:MAG: hypothetical protein K2Q09_07685, partial [Phycisphaerales bacterium]|nr:hypothetical protein [Phycisphaerales bacterium]
MYHSLVGKPPFVGDTVFDTLKMHEQKDVSTLFNSGDIDEKLENIVVKGLSKDPKERQSCMEEIVDGLTQIQLSIEDASRTKSGATVSASVETKRSWSKSPGISTVVLCVLALVFIVGILSVSYGFSESSTPALKLNQFDSEYYRKFDFTLEDCLKNALADASKFESQKLPGKAMEVLEKAVRRCKKGNFFPRKLYTDACVKLLAYKLDRPKERDELAEEVVQTAKVQSDYSDQSESFVAFAAKLFVLNDAKGAVKFEKYAQELHKPDGQFFVESNLRLGQYYSSAGEYAKAVEALKESERAERNPKSKEREESRLIELHRAYLNLKRESDARDCFERARKIGKKRLEFGLEFDRYTISCAQG